jgi:hypothetical protein
MKIGEAMVSGLELLGLYQRPEEPRQALVSVDQTGLTPLRLSVTSEPEDVPEFKRIYTAAVPGGFTVEVTLKSWYYSYGGLKVSAMGQVTQSNGPWILFEPERVADKIIDRELYPHVQAVVDEAYRLDKAWRAPSEFTDQRGHVWRRLR